MFGFSFAKILVLAVVVIGVWRLFKWIETRADAGIKKQARKTQEPVVKEKTGDVELEQDPVTGVWRPKL
ncbi:MAG: hypothetical protein ACKVGZ_02375 [Alphaproteobacteria bacterium]|jgi:hypothetical protein